MPTPSWPNQPRPSASGGATLSDRWCAPARERSTAAIAPSGGPAAALAAAGASCSASEASRWPAVAAAARRPSPRGIEGWGRCAMPQPLFPAALPGPLSCRPTQLALPPRRGPRTAVVRGRQGSWTAHAELKRARLMWKMSAETAVSQGDSRPTMAHALALHHRTQ